VRRVLEKKSGDGGWLLSSKLTVFGRLKGSREWRARWGRRRRLCRGGSLVGPAGASLVGVSSGLVDRFFPATAGGVVTAERPLKAPPPLNAAIAERKRGLLVSIAGGLDVHGEYEALAAAEGCSRGVVGFDGASWTRDSWCSGAAGGLVSIWAEAGCEDVVPVKMDLGGFMKRAGRDRPGQSAGRGWRRRNAALLLVEVYERRQRHHSPEIAVSRTQLRRQKQTFSNGKRDRVQPGDAPRMPIDDGASRFERTTQIRPCGWKNIVGAIC
jgi:hypothetical protein